MPTELELNIDLILHYLVDLFKKSKSYTPVTGNDIRLATGLEPFRINQAIELMKSDGLIDREQTYGTAPFMFHSIKLTAKGENELERKRWQKLLEPLEKKEPPSELTPNREESPVGSPFGFTSKDWKAISDSRAKKNTLYVVFGCKFESAFCNYLELEKNIDGMFKAAVARYNKENQGAKVDLKFSALHAGYGEHLFNEIARDIISSDIAVFETSDMAPNVFIEIGVALTWGSRVLLIKDKQCPRPPTDISGQTYVDYSDNGKIFADSGHFEKLYQMVERSIKKKS